MIELDREKEALPLINEIRERAKKSTGLIDYAENVDIALYVDNVNCNWTKPYAREALRWERRLELAMESQRFFDLVRWGIADSVINTSIKKKPPNAHIMKMHILRRIERSMCQFPNSRLISVNRFINRNYGY